MAFASIFGNVEIEDVVVPAGDPGERLIAKLILSTIAFDVHAEPAARRHLAEAHLLAMDLANHSLVYRPLRPSHFARLIWEFDGVTEATLLPLIENVLVFPAMTFEGIAVGREADVPAVKVKALDLARFMLRLRPRRIASILEALERGASGREPTETVRRILAGCTRHELPAGEPLDRANDFLTVARILIGKQNAPLAVLALNNADSALAEAHRQADAVAGPVAPILQMKQQVGQMVDELKRAAM
jgi:hypothetical protein